MRDFALILGEDYERAAREVAGVVVNSYFYRRHEAGGGKAFDVAVRALETFSGLFGPYPYTELDVDEALTQYSTLLYYEKAYGKERADGILYSEFIQTYESLKGTGRDMPAGLPADSYPPVSIGPWCTTKALSTSMSCGKEWETTPSSRFCRRTMSGTATRSPRQPHS
ncbi:MAG: hypothetical protein U9R72_05020 [Chloroflexota bacterium]|nr:hypothetical protein [Chloroflexota bacterium]